MLKAACAIAFVVLILVMLAGIALETSGKCMKDLY